MKLSKRTLKGIAKRIKDARTCRGLSQRQFAKKLGYSQQWFAYSERTGEASTNMLIALGDKFGISADWIMWGVGSPEI